MKVKTKNFNNKPDDFVCLTNWLNTNLGDEVNVNDIHLILQATDVYHEPLTYHLHDLDFKVSLINPAFIKHHADGLGGVRQKTDKKDSTILAKYGRATHPDTWITPSDDARQILGLDMMSFLKIIIFSFFYPWKNPPHPHLE